METEIGHCGKIFRIAMRFMRWVVTWTSNHPQAARFSVSNTDTQTARFGVSNIDTDEPKANPRKLINMAKIRYFLDSVKCSMRVAS